MKTMTHMFTFALFLGAFSTFAYDITEPVKPNESQRLAVEELKHHLAAKADEVPYRFVFARPADAPKPAPFTSYYRVDGDSVWFWGDDRGWAAFDWGQKRGHQTGALHNGSLFAVETFAQRELGMRWIWPGETGQVVKRVKTLSLPAKSEGSFETKMPLATVRNYQHYDSVPWGEVSSVMPREVYDAPQWTTYETRGIWQVRNRLQQRDIIPYGHAFENWIKRFKDTHPEYLNLHIDPKTGKETRGYTDGREHFHKRCVSNEGAVDQIIADWLKGGTNRYLNVCENDGAHWCECAACRALDVPKEGEDAYVHLTDRHVNFWNRIAKKAVAIRPDVMLVTYAYSAYRYPPRREKLEYPDNMLLGYVFGGGEDWRAMLESWKAVGMRHFFNRPNHLHYKGSIPAGYGRYFYDEFQGMRRYGMMGCDYDADDNRRVQNLEFYVLVRLCADPDESFEQIFDDFCSAYGAAKDEVRAYFEVVEREGMAARELALRKKERKVEDFDEDTPRKVPLMQAFGHSESNLLARLEMTRAIRRRHEKAKDLSEIEMRNVRELELVAEQAVLVYRLFVSVENAPLDELKKIVDDLQSFRIAHCRDLEDTYAGIYRRWWGEIQIWNHYYRKRLKEGK